MKFYPKILIFLFLYYIIFAAASFYQGTPRGDEKYFHIPAEQLIEKYGVKGLFMKEYEATNTPLPYFLTALPNILIKNSLITTRLTTLLFSIICSLFLWHIFNKNKLYNKKNVESIVILLMFPHYLMTSFVFYIPIYGLAFFFSAYYILFYTENKYKFYLSGLLVSLAVLSQQYYLGIYLSLFLYYIFQKLSPKQIFINLLQFSVFLIFPFILFYLWKGISINTYYGIGFNFQNLTSIFLTIGFYFFPLTIILLKKSDIKLILLSLFIALIFTIFFTPFYESVYYFKGSYSGIAYRLFNTASTVSPIITKALVLISSATGIIHLIKIFFSENNEHLFLKITSSVFIIIYFFSDILFEKHLLPLFIMLFLITIPLIKMKYLRIYSVLISILGTIYFFYWLFFKELN